MMNKTILFFYRGPRQKNCNGTWYDGTQITFICEWDEVSANSGATVDEEAMARAAAMLLDDECWMKTGGEDVLATHYHVMDMNQGNGS